MDIELRTNSAGETLVLRGFHRFGDGSGGGCTLEVRSRGFRAAVMFAVEPEPLATFLTQVERLDCDLKGKARLKPMFEDPFVEFEVLPPGRVRVRGQLMEYSEQPQQLRFEFETDQTVLRPLLEDLRRT